MLDGANSLELTQPEAKQEVMTHEILKIIALIKTQNFSPDSTVAERFTAISKLIAQHKINYALELNEFICLENELKDMVKKTHQAIAQQCAMPAQPEENKENISADKAASQGAALVPTSTKAPILTTNSRLAIDLALMYAATQTDLAKIPPLNDYAARKFLIDFYNKLGINDNTPYKKLALDMGLSLASVYLNPQAYAQYSFGKGLERILAKIAPNHVLSIKNTINILLALTANAPRTLISSYLPSLVAQYGSAVYLAAPLAALIFHKGPDALEALFSQEITSSAGDFFDLMYGQADDATYEKYQDLWMCKDIGTLTAEITAPVTNGLFWLGNKVMPKFFAQTKPKDQKPIAEQEIAAQESVSEPKVTLT